MYSMTGYGMGEHSNEKFHVKVEIKSVNNRYCDIAIRLPKNLIALEDKIKREIRNSVSRGKIDVFINIENLESDNSEIDVDLDLAKQYFDAFTKLREKLNIKDEISLSDIYKMQGVITATAKDEDIEEYWNVLSVALNTAIKNFLEMRKVEGENLKLDIEEKLRNIKTSSEAINEKAPISLEENTNKLKENIKNNLKDENLDIQRLTTEVAIMCDKLSIDEEITRIFLHISQFNDIINLNEPVGRKLDFLIQELNREVNTVGSKSTDIEILNNVVNLKSEIEKIREQIQNIE